MTFSPTVHMFLYTITTPYFIMERHSFLFKGTSDKLQSGLTRVIPPPIISKTLFAPATKINPALLDSLVLRPSLEAREERRGNNAHTHIHTGSFLVNPPHTAELGWVHNVSN